MCTIALVGSPLTKRGYIRKRVPWSEKEVAALHKGLRLYGVGNWAKILRNSLDFHSCRNSSSIRDKYRNLVKLGEL